MSEKNYNYREEDSLFINSVNSLSKEDSVNKIIEKRVDSEPELLDFRARKLSVADEKADNFKLFVNINSASIEILKQLPGIGEKTAANIVDFRNKNGPFKAIQELLLVKGIGEAKFNRIKEYIFIE